VTKGRQRLKRFTRREIPRTDTTQISPNQVKKYKTSRVLLVSAKEIPGPVDNRLMSFLAVLQVIGSLQVVSSCAVAVYAIAAWRRKGPARETPTPFDSVPEALKLLADLQRHSQPPTRWRKLSPLARAEAELSRAEAGLSRAEAELSREAELQRRGPSAVNPLASALTEREESVAPVGLA
jgi:hypothetical protein